MFIGCRLDGVDDPIDDDPVNSVIGKFNAKIIFQCLLEGALNVVDVDEIEGRETEL